jgi:hypothetical protein
MKTSRRSSERPCFHHRAFREPELDDRLREPGTITTKSKLLTSAWTADVSALETAIRRLRMDPREVSCQIVLFEIAGDRHLHVNVIHEHETVHVNGWTGPAPVPAGFVNKRTFAHSQPRDTMRRILNMVLAAEISPPGKAPYMNARSLAVRRSQVVKAAARSAGSLLQPIFTGRAR